MGQIRITLLSDSCISSGESYNSSIDNDVCYDSYGLPFIPAKRIRGCLREAAQELRDFGMNINADVIFGKAGNSPAAISISSAKLVKYDEYVDELKRCRRREYTHQQSVLNQFTYVRYQTRIDAESGTAEETSLRATRVMKRGLEFAAEVKVPNEHAEVIEKCCRQLRFMGMNRTRGMGEVQVRYYDLPDTAAQTAHAEWREGADYCRLDYRIRLKAPILLKSVAGGQTQTLSYIDGAKLLGMLAQNLQCDGQSLIELTDKGCLICSNAYVSDGRKRYTPISASLFGIKNDKGHIRDRAFAGALERGNVEGKQLVQLDGVYVDSDTADTLRKLTVDTEIRYHHSRPQDKSRGHVLGDEANSEEGGSFYQTESISEGQMLQGFILGSSEQLKIIYDIIVSNPLQRMGYGKTSEYGEAECTVISLEEKNGHPSDIEAGCEAFIVKLNAPAILYNENGMYSTDERVLLGYIVDEMRSKGVLQEGQELEIADRFLKYAAVGGFNTTWGLHKPVINGFDAGTTLVIRLTDGSSGQVDISRMTNVFLGERVPEGYGEAVFYLLPASYEKECVEGIAAEQVVGRTGEPHSSELIRAIATGCAYDYIQSLGRKTAAELKVSKDENMTAVISNLLLMCKQQETFESFRWNMNKRFDKTPEKKQTKLKMAEKIFPKSLESLDEIRDKVLEKYPEAVLEENKVYKVYVTALLTAVKYRLREEK